MIMNQEMSALRYGGRMTVPTVTRRRFSNRTTTMGAINESGNGRFINPVVHNTDRQTFQLAKGFLTEVAPYSDKRYARRQQMGIAEMENRMIAAHNGGYLRFVGDGGVDTERLIGLISGGMRARVNGHATNLAAPKKLSWAINEMKASHQWAGRRMEAGIEEHLMDGLSMSQFARFLESCTRLGTYEFCARPDVAPILSCFGRIQIACNQRELATDFDLMSADMLEDWQVEDEQTPMIGLETPCYIGVPRPCKIKFGMAIKRELLCGDVAENILRVMARGAELLDEKLAKQGIRLMLNLWDDPEDNRWPYAIDGVAYHPYYPHADCEGIYPWSNWIPNANDPECSNQIPMCMVEQANDEMRNPITNRRMDCGLNSKDIIATSTKQSQVFRQNLGGFSVEAPLQNGMPGGPKFGTYQQAPRSGWSGEIKEHPMIRDCLREFYGRKYSDRKSVEQAVNRTFLMGNTRRMFAITTEWQRETLTRQAPNTFEYWNQEIVMATKWMEKVGFVSLEPWAGQLFEGVPDGDPCNRLIANKPECTDCQPI